VHCEAKSTEHLPASQAKNMQSNRRHLNPGSFAE